MFGGDQRIFDQYGGKSPGGAFVLPSERNPPLHGWEVCLVTLSDLKASNLQHGSLLTGKELLCHLLQCKAQSPPCSLGFLYVLTNVLYPAPPHDLDPPCCHFGLENTAPRLCISFQFRISALVAWHTIAPATPRPFLCFLSRLRVLMGFFSRIKGP